ncbi:hypothetical protein Trydic_g11574 [Trypoxylus dichotomus]
MEIVRDLVEKAEIVDPEFEVVDSSEPEDDYLAVYKVVSACGGNEYMELLVKLMPLLELIQRNNCPILKLAPTCYKVVNMATIHAIVLEHLAADGYRILDRSKPMPRDHIEIVLQGLGHFHALCFVFKDENRLAYKSIIQRIRDPFEGYKLGVDFHALLRHLAQIVKDSLKDNKRIFSVFHKFSEDMKPLLSCVETIKNDPYAIIAHSNGWTNNFLFKYDVRTDPTKPIDFCIFDWQMMTTAPPVLDVAYFFYSVCSQTDMDMIDHYLDVYYSHLSAYMGMLGGSADVLYPHETFLVHWRVFSQFGLTFALFNIRIMLADRDETMLMKEVFLETRRMSNAFVFPIKKEETYKKRIRDIIMHFDEKEYFVHKY